VNAHIDKAPNAATFVTTPSRTIAGALDPRAFSTVTEIRPLKAERLIVSR
jgi:hypothetical protein